VTPGIRVTAGAIGSVIDLRTPRTGRVHSVFAHAVNLELGGDMWTLVAPGGPDAALTVRLSGAVLPGDLGLRVNDPVYVRFRHVRAGPAVIDARTAVRWMPQWYDADPCGLGERAAELEAAARPVAWEGSWALADSVAGAASMRPSAGRSAAGPGSRPPATTCSRASSPCSPRPQWRPPASRPRPAATPSRLAFARLSRPPCPPPPRSAVRC